MGWRMQTLWNRIAQSSGLCACPQCVHAVQAVSRRATTSATRRPRYPTSSTLWYSGVFAAAATYDASVKQRRREQWDQAIADVKGELGQTAEVNDTASVKTPASPARESSPIATTVSNVVDLFQEVDPLGKRPEWPTNTGPPLIVRHLPPESIYATDMFKKRAEASRWYPKKLERAQLSMDIVQLFMWKEMQNLESCEDALSTVPEKYQNLMPSSSEELDEAIQTKLAQLDYLRTVDSVLTGYSRHKLDVALCHYNQDEYGSYHYQARQLNSALKDLFCAHHRGNLTSAALLAKVAFNLHASSAPPSIHIHNTLLVGLEEAGHRSVVGAVVASVRDVAARPNEVTHACILRHYAATNNAVNFSNWVGRLRGKHGGVALARSDVNITGAGRSRLVPHPDKPGKVIQLPYPTPLVFAAIIEGMLKFAGFETALRICRGMGDEGWGLCMSGLTPLLRECADNRDWTSGMAVWREVQALRARDIRRSRNREHVGQNIDLGTFATMLRLCSQCNQRATFDEIWLVAARTHGQCEQDLMVLIKAEQETYQRNLAARSEPQGVVDPYLWISNRPKMAPSQGNIDFVQPQLSDNQAWRLEIRNQVVRDLQDGEAREDQHFYRLKLEKTTSIHHGAPEAESNDELSRSAAALESGTSTSTSSTSHRTQDIRPAEEVSARAPRVRDMDSQAEFHYDRSIDGLGKLLPGHQQVGFIPIPLVENDMNRGLVFRQKAI